METSPHGLNFEHEAATFGQLPPLAFMTVTVFNMGRLVIGMSHRFLNIGISFFLSFFFFLFIFIFILYIFIFIFLCTIRSCADQLCSGFV